MNAATEHIPYLCGGTFFELLMRAKKPSLSAREHYSGISDDQTDPIVLLGLVGIINPELKKDVDERCKKDKYARKSLKTTTSEYRRCNISDSPTYFKFRDEDVIENFNKNILKSYESLLDAMTLFINTFIDIKTEMKCDRLVKSLLELIELDGSIVDDEKFYMGHDGQTKTKAELRYCSEIDLSAFLLGIWHFIIYNKERKNAKGADTIQEWYLKTERSDREYMGLTGNILAERKVDVRVEIIDNSYDAIAIQQFEQCKENDMPIENDENVITTYKEMSTKEMRKIFEDAIKECRIAKFINSGLDGLRNEKMLDRVDGFLQTISGIDLIILLVKNPSKKLLYQQIMDFCHELKDYSEKSKLLNSTFSAYFSFIDEIENQRWRINSLYGEICPDKTLIVSRSR